MRRGSIVVYSQQHYLWLQQVGRWPNKYFSRREWTGNVIDGGNGWDGRGAVRVRWRDGEHTWHFADNLEAVDK